MQRLSQRWMRVYGSLQILGAGLELHGKGRLGDELAGHRTNDVHAQDGIALPVGQNRCV